jgi:hypothetical protein
MDEKMTPADLAAMRVRKGRTDEQMYKDARDANMKKRMEKMPPRPRMEIGELPANMSMSEEDKQMSRDTDAGYEFAKRQPLFKKGGMVGSASKRADGCAVRGKTKGMMR